MANKISPSTEGHAFLIQIQNILSITFGRPHLYQNFSFGAEVSQQPPTILFGHIPISDVEVTTPECSMRLFEVLLKYDPLLSLDSSDNVTDCRSERLCKVMYQSDLSQEKSPNFTLVGP